MHSLNEGVLLGAWFDHCPRVSSLSKWFNSGGFCLIKFVGCFDRGGVFYLYFLLFVIFDCSYDFNGVRSPRFWNFDSEWCVLRSEKRFNLGSERFIVRERVEVHHVTNGMTLSNHIAWEWKALVVVLRKFRIYCCFVLIRKNDKENPDDKFATQSRLCALDGNSSHFCTSSHKKVRELRIDAATYVSEAEGENNAGVLTYHCLNKSRVIPRMVKKRRVEEHHTHALDKERDCY